MVSTLWRILFCIHYYSSPLERYGTRSTNEWLSTLRVGRFGHHILDPFHVDGTLTGYSQITSKGDYFSTLVNFNVA